MEPTGLSLPRWFVWRRRRPCFGRAPTAPVAESSHRSSRSGNLGVATSTDQWMSQVPYIPSSAPFTPEQRAWLNGYLTGLFADANVARPEAGVSPSRLAGSQKPD